MIQASNEQSRPRGKRAHSPCLPHCAPRYLGRAVLAEQPQPRLPDPLTPFCTNLLWKHLPCPHVTVKDPRGITAQHFELGNSNCKRQVVHPPRTSWILKEAAETKQLPYCADGVA